jgi:nucleoside-diphosphate-sugar epimerase
VEDVASAFVNIMESDVQGPVNIASGRPICLKEVIIKIGEKTGRSDLIRLGEKAAPGDDPPLLIADIRRLREEVNWSARYTLDEGIDKAIRWWKNNLGIDNGKE